MGTGLSQGCAHFEERKDGMDGVRDFMFLESRRRSGTFTLNTMSQTAPLVDTSERGDRF